MIVGLPCGFYVPALIPKEHRIDGDPRIVQVRTRRAIDLDRLRNLYLPDLSETVILDKPSDFQYRAYCTKEQWGEALMRASMDMDYINEKNVVLDRFKDHTLYRLYEKIWTAALDVFPIGSMYSISRKGHQVKQNKFASTYNVTPTFAVADDPVHYTPMSSLTQRQRDRLFDEKEPEVWELEEAQLDLDLWNRSEAERRKDAFRQQNIAFATEDHLICDHADTRSARKRCRRKNKG